MHKKYLNREDRVVVNILGSFAAYLEKFINHHKDMPKAKVALKYARMSKAFVLKVVDEYFVNLNMDERKKVIAEVGQLQVVTRYTDEAVREYKKMQELDENTVLPNEDFYDLVEEVIEVTCKGCQSDPEGCKVRRVFAKHDIAPYDCEAEGCQYKC